MILETRRCNIKAVAFYLNHGYKVISNYGKYVDKSEAICFEKKLNDSEPRRKICLIPVPVEQLYYQEEIGKRGGKGQGGRKSGKSVVELYLLGWIGKCGWKIGGIRV